MRRNVYSSAGLTEGRPLCTQILPGQGRPPSTILCIRKLQTLAYRISRFATMPECDGQTDIQTYRFAIAYTAACKASFVARCKKYNFSFDVEEKSYQRHACFNAKDKTSN